MFRRTLKKIKKKLVKQIKVTNCFEKGPFIAYSMELSNFFTLRKNIFAQLFVQKNHYNLSYELNKKTLTIYIPKELLNTIETRAVVKLNINNKLMWITADNNFPKYEGNIIYNKSYFTTSVNKNIALSKRFSEYYFQEENVLIHDIQADYNTLNFKLKEIPNYFELDGMQIYAINNNKIKELQARYEQNESTLIVNDFSSFSLGAWKLFLVQNNALYQLKTFEETGDIQFKTYNHNVELFTHNTELYLMFNPHVINVDSITINKIKQNVIMDIRSDDFVKGKSYKFFVDNQNGTDMEFNLKKKNTNCVSIEISSEVLCENFSIKRFFIVEDCLVPLKKQFNINKENLIGNAVKYDEIIDSQHVKVSFYVRKDRSLGVRVPKPKLRKVIEEIEGFVLTGFVGSLDRFFECTAFLSIEERNSGEYFDIPIDGTFEIDVAELDLINLKSKDKTVFDLFIIIKNTADEVIRKEKIKYKHADYKKDNYYDYKLIKDAKLNQHHFLITTTPFDNLKIESFLIPADIRIPEDTSFKDENVWLIGERYNTAQDNGIALFNWLRDNTNIEAYYVIEEDAEDYKKIKGKENVLLFGSKQHFEIAFKAKVLLGTHDLENILPYKPGRGFFHYENTYKVFLQHGVLGRKNVEYHKRFYEVPFDLFIVSSDPEKYDVVVKEFGYDESEVAVTGLARFDNLIHSVEPKDILLMPTWRDWINTDAQFFESQYYKFYSNMIKNPKLIDLLETYDVNLNFYPHYRAQPYFNSDLPNLSERINFIPLGSKKVQDLLIEHALLITDFSSVSFDFSLMEKPVIYYHFDVKRFFRKGILRPVEETFIGRVVHTEEEMVEAIEERLVQGLGNYELDTSQIIKYKDLHNRERIFNTIISNMKSGENNL